MKITYVSHACIVIETKGKKLVTDPWVKGSAYCGQWHLFPKPIAPEMIRDADFVVYSHGHEDHLHGKSLATIHKSAKLYYPYSWYGGTTEFFQSLGFKNVTEVMNEQTIDLQGIKVTYLSNNLDNVIVIDDGEQVLVNINDALPSASAAMIGHFIHKIKKRWPKIDYVFSSYGGASYFPNTVHYAHKNDREIGEARELFFLTNFCRIIEELQPKWAVPFATDFVLLDPEQRWINELKLPRNQLASFFNTFSGGRSPSMVLEAYPNDVISEGKFISRSPYHEKVKKTPLLQTIDEDYREEIEAKKNEVMLSAEKLKETFEKAKQHILGKQYIIPEETRKTILFGIRISNTREEKNILLVDFRQGNTQFKTVSELPKDADLLISLRSKTLNYAIGSEWGGDAIIIGYGAEVFIYNEDCILHEYENYCVRLLSRYPNTREYLKKTPLRAIKYLLSDEIKRKNLIRKITGKNNEVLEYTDTRLSDRDLWLNKSKCDVCKACNILNDQQPQV